MGGRKEYGDELYLIYKEKKTKEKERKLISLVCLPFEPLR